MKFQLISDSACDLPLSLIEEKGIQLVPFYVSFDHENYLKEMQELKVRDFYQMMVDNPKVYPTTSLPSIQDYLDVFTPCVEAGTPVLCICISDKLSGSYHSAVNARDIILEDYPDAKIVCINSIVNTVLQGLFVLEAARIRDAGHDLLETVKLLETLKSTGRILFTVGNMEYLKAGGRIGKLKGLAVDTLGIKPLIMLKEGEIFNAGLSRSRKKAKHKLVASTLEYISEIHDTPDHFRFGIGYGYDRDEGEELRKELAKALTGYAEIDDIPLLQIGVSTAVHTGPYPIGIVVIRRFDAAMAAVSEDIPIMQRAQNLFSHAKTQVAQATEYVKEQFGSHKDQD